MNRDFKNHPTLQYIDSVMWIWTQSDAIILAFRIRVAKNQSKAWETHIKIDKKSSEYHLFGNRSNTITNINDNFIL